jgi:hypothetical protein
MFRRSEGGKEEEGMRLAARREQIHNKSKEEKNQQNLRRYTEYE